MCKRFSLFARFWQINVNSTRVTSAVGGVAKEPPDPAHRKKAELGNVFNIFEHLCDRIAPLSTGCDHSYIGNVFVLFFCSINEKNVSHRQQQQQQQICRQYSYIP